MPKKHDRAEIAETVEKSSIFRQREFRSLWEAFLSAMGEMGHDGLQTGLPQACHGTKTEVSRNAK